ncbi:MAG TPA: hypothetical protein PLJ27_23555, partial [Polyangiaceae bacterium]|nr:hypothetical protein [Polyangiaceae bacterium]
DVLPDAAQLTTSIDGGVLVRAGSKAGGATASHPKDEARRVANGLSRSLGSTAAAIPHEIAKKRRMNARFLTVIKGSA